MRASQITAFIGSGALVAASLVLGSGVAATAAPPATNPAAVCVPSDTAMSVDCTVTYLSTGAEQIFTVPSGVSSLKVELIGANGGAAVFAAGGRGDRVTGSLTVAAGDLLYVNVGSAGSQTTGGFNGGGASGYTDNGRQAGGGGATDVRTISSASPGSLESRVAVAGGGGGAAFSFAGGDAGQAGASTDTVSGGGAGTASSGGAGGIGDGGTPSGSPGALGVGGAGGADGPAGAHAGGGGGGGGLYGGGGGAGEVRGSGGGGSSLVPAGGQNAVSGAGSVARLTYTEQITSLWVQSNTLPAKQAVPFVVYVSSPSIAGSPVDVTSRLASLTPVSTLTAGVQLSDLSCTAPTCTAAKAGLFTVRAGFAGWHSDFLMSFESTMIAQNITFTHGAINLGQPRQLAATSNSGLPVSYTLVSGPCTLQGDVLTAHDTGGCRVTASQAGENPYLAALSVTEDFTVAATSLVASTDPSALTATAGVPYTFPVEFQNAQGAPLTPQPTIDYSSSDCDIETGNVFTEARACTITASVAGVPRLTTTFTVQVVAGALDGLTIVPTTQPSVKRGGSLTFDVSGADAYGNPVDTSSAVLTSSVATDQISGLTVTFPHASPHVITATIGAVSSSVKVEVIDASKTPDDGLADTGLNASATPMLLAGACALLLAGGVLLVARRGFRGTDSSQ